MIPVSVVIPCYRCAGTIERAVTSAAIQTLRPVEVILIDDASCDATVGVLKSIKNKYGSWIRIVELSVNLGAASTRNAGWNLASQPFVAFLDADDSWHPEKLRVQYEFMRDNPSIAVSGHQSMVLGYTDKMPQHINFRPVVAEINPISLIFKGAFSTPSVMLKRDIKFRFYEGKRYAEDAYLWQVIAFAGLRIVRIESCLAFIHKELYGAGGLSGNMWKMEVSELSNFLSLRRSGHISVWMMMAAFAFSLAKYTRRLGIQCVRYGLALFSSKAHKNC